MEENLKVEDFKKQIDDVVQKAKEQFEFEINKDSKTLDFKKTTIHGSSKQLQGLMTALALYNGEVDTPKKTTKGVHGSYYATLSEVFDCLKPVMSKHGLSLIQIPTIEGVNVAVSNILTHKEGGYISFESISAKPMQANAQQIGSVISYLKRYSASAIMLLASDVDDDADSASGFDRNNPPKGKAPVTPEKTASPKETQVEKEKREEAEKLAKEKKVELDKTIKLIDKEVTRIVGLEKGDLIAPIVTKEQAEKNFKKIKDVKIAKSVLAELKKVK